jgi:predicted nucleic acid-binding protein
MTYALDTNIISYILRGDKNLKSRLRQEELKGNISVIPLMVYYEVKRGLLSKDATGKMKSFEELCAAWEVYDLTKSDMDEAARIYADLRRVGRPIDDGDLLIAAQCITNGYTLVTHNTKHFEGVEGLAVEDWVM